MDEKTYKIALVCENCDFYSEHYRPFGKFWYDGLKYTCPECGTADHKRVRL